MKTNVLHTGRLTLTPVEPSMLSELHALFTNPSVRRYLMDDTIVGPDWVEEVIETSQRRFTEAGYGLWAVQLTGQSAVIGVCGFVVIDQLQLLYALLPDYWGQGLATEASRVVVDYAFRQAGLTEIVAAADLPNTSSFGVMHQLGMVPWKTEDGIAYYRLTV